MQYLALVRTPGGTEHWVLVKWGKPAAVSDPNQEEGWVQGGFRLKIEEVLKAYSLPDILEALEKP